MRTGENPFYILQASPRDPRQKLISLFQEKMLLEDHARFQEAESLLLAPEQRIDAELCWFPGLSSSEVTEILGRLERAEAMDSASYSAIVKFNLAYENYFHDHPEDGSFEKILNLDHLFSELDGVELFDQINGDRALADFPPIDDMKMVFQALDDRKTEAVQAIDESLQNLTLEEYAALMARLAGTIDGAAKGGIMEALTECYARRIKALLDEKNQAIYARLSEIDAGLQEPENHIFHLNGEIFNRDHFVQASIELLLNDVEKWDDFAQPLQLKCRAFGLDHEDSAKIANDIRSLAMKLHNNYQFTWLSLKMMERLQAIFAELPGFSALFENDIKTLKNIIDVYQSGGASTPAPLEAPAPQKTGTRKRKLKRKHWIMIGLIAVAVLVLSIAVPMLVYVSGDLSAEIEKSHESGNAIAAGYTFAAEINPDGTLDYIDSGDDYQCDIWHWTDIKQIDAGRLYIVGLHNDGTCIASGKDNYGQCAVSDWTDIIFVDASLNHTVGIKSDHTVVAVGADFYGQCAVSGWSDIRAVAGGDRHTVGVRTDGTCIATGDNDNGQCDVGDWKNICQVVAGGDFTVGLMKNGRLKGAGIDLGRFTDRYTALAAGEDYVVGLKGDGTVDIVISSQYDISAVESWSSIVAITSGPDSVVGLQKDSTVVSTSTPLTTDEGIIDFASVLRPQDFPENGYIFYDNGAAKKSKIVITSDGDSAYYIKLVNPDTGDDIVRFFVRPGEKVSVKVPAGNYQLKYCYGETWYGEEHLFGEDTIIQDYPDLFEFSSTYYYTWTVH